MLPAGLPEREGGEMAVKEEGRIERNTKGEGEA